MVGDGRVLGRMVEEELGAGSAMSPEPEVGFTLSHELRAGSWLCLGAGSRVYLALEPGAGFALP